MDTRNELDDGDKSFYAMVGELVVASTTLDDQMTSLLVYIFSGESNVCFAPILATLDAARKIEIIKAHCKMNSFARIPKALNIYTGKVEKVFKQRNIVCHTPPSREEGKWGYRPVALAKILHPRNTYNSSWAKDSLDKISEAISLAHVALQAGSDLIESYEKHRAEEVDYYKQLKSKRRR